MPHLKLYVFAGFTVLMIASAVLFTALRPGPISQLDTWNIGGAPVPLSPRVSLPTQQPVGQQSTSTETLNVPLPQSESVPSVTFDDLAELLAELTLPKNATPEDSADFVPSSYAFIPQGLISIVTEKPRTPEQQALYEYGNSLGLALNAFESSHPDMPQTLKDQAEDRGNAAKALAVKKLAGDFSALGSQLSGMTSIPSGAAAIHTQLAAAYTEVGTKLALIPDASGDDVFVAAINTYNTSSETLSLRLISLVDLFQSRSVTFSANDPGSAFTFSAGASF